MRKTLAAPTGLFDCVRARAAPKVAVQDLSFGVRAGEVFGFLGINGAGKTTTLRMLSGDELPSSGRASLGGFDIIKEQAAVRRLLGCACGGCDAHARVLARTRSRAHARAQIALA